MFSAIFMRDVRLAWQSGGAAAGGVAFFGMSYALMAVAFSPEHLASIRLPLMAIGVLFTLMLSLNALLEEDLRDGTLEQYLLLPMARSWLMLAKMLAYWCSHMLPVLLLAAAIQWAEQSAMTIGRLIWMSLWLTALGGLSATMALMHDKGALTRALITIPLYLPALIAATLPDPSSQMLLIQIAVTLILWPIAAWAGGYLLNLAVD